MDNKLRNFIQVQFNRIVNVDADDKSYAYLYKDFDHDKLRMIFAVLHCNLIAGFSCMNQRLPTSDNSAHFWAAPSRSLLGAINSTLTLCEKLKGTEVEFSIDEDYFQLIVFCKGFLSSSGGSTIPPETSEIEIYETIPIFLQSDTIGIKRATGIFPFALKLIGEGSYAKVFKYEDEFYNREFVLKRAKADLTNKEKERFKREFEEMREFSSPYIVEVYNFDDTKHEYIMELMDATLHKHIVSENSKLTQIQRKSLINQIFRAFQYIHSKNRLHRDISPNNILIKQYEDATVIIKISDFGLVKTPSSELTSTNTDFKGWFNDPALKTEGFNNYELLHETYALTLVAYFVLTGKTNVVNIKETQIKAFVEKGTNPDKTKRFQNIRELIDAIRLL